MNDMSNTNDEGAENTGASAISSTLTDQGLYHAAGKIAQTLEHYGSEGWGQLIECGGKVYLVQGKLMPEGTSSL